MGALVTGTTYDSGVKDRAFHTDLSVFIEGVDITEDISDRLITMSYTDNEEDAADDLQIKIHDADGKWLKKWLNDTIMAATAKETKGMTIEAGIKTTEPSGRVRELDCGEFELDNIKASGPPSTVVLKGTSLPFGDGVRTEERDKAWEEYTLKKIGAEIAARAGLGYMYDCSSDPYYARIEQVKQTDISFLQDLCHKNGFSLKVVKGKMVIFSQERYESLQEVATIKWQDGTYTKYDFQTADGDVHYAKCTVRYFHPEKKELYSATVEADDYDPESENNQTLVITTERVESNGEAEALAKQLLRLHNKFEAHITFTMIGNPMLGAGMCIKLEDFGLFDDKYIIKQCKHEISNSVYTTKITLRPIIIQAATPEAEAEQKTTFEVGDIVYFSGGLVYEASDITKNSGTRKPGNAKITLIAKEGAPHRYHLIGGKYLNDVDGDCNVWGWVDEGSFAGTGNTVSTAKPSDGAFSSDSQKKKQDADASWTVNGKPVKLLGSTSGAETLVMYEDGSMAYVSTGSLKK